MKAETIELSGRLCRFYESGDAAVVVRGVPVADWEDGRINKQLNALADTGASFFVYPVGEWNDDFSPWPAKTRAGDFGGQAEKTLTFLREEVLPFLHGRKDAPLILAGYSLAGLFSLWCMGQGAGFDGYVSCSGSLWYPGWENYMCSARADSACCVYLSLGDREAATRNPDLCRVEEMTVAQSLKLVSDHHVTETVLVMEKGGHFAEPDARLARGIRWAVEHVKSKAPPRAPMEAGTLLQGRDRG